MKRDIWCRRAIRAAACLFLLALLIPQPVQASDWMFRPSYYSHNPPRGVRVGQQPLPRSSYGRQFGEYFRSGYYFNGYGGINLRNNFPRLRSYESWIQGGSQW